VERSVRAGDEGTGGDIPGGGGGERGGWREDERASAAAARARIAGICGDFGTQHILDPDLEGVLGYDGSDADKAITALVTLEGLADDRAFMHRSFVDAVYVAFTGSAAPEDYLDVDASSGNVRPWP
jgi:hypothetical protein